MLQAIAPNIWHVQHEFAANGLRISSRMTVVRLANGALWLHSPIPIDAVLRSQLMALGKVDFIVAPNKMHHLFAAECQAAFPGSKLFGAPGLKAKRPDLKELIELDCGAETAWQDELEQLFFGGIPLGNETVWFHKASGTLILTDLCQWWQGELPFAAKAYATLTGVRRQLAVPRMVRWMVKDRQAARISAQGILRWPITRVISAHNVIVEQDAHAALEKAFSCFIDG
ncbi:uncharacterized protein DUF4336 [Collimonas sp. PA-H2]|uniref:DUF4336 domain-containing protein n=1 Tax=Collimonas sp. PA-H2 TaxID=1881062 RepID=UPI000BF8F931|nr:DUF4336 domain-containing protein [Collimonas sp. PA-H2]PFH11060.1 uncharacterized protein DUF4336 [Collimonas sp. PA-H2]